jgi:hypothetical protein
MGCIKYKIGKGWLLSGGATHEGSKITIPDHYGSASQFVDVTLDKIYLVCFDVTEIIGTPDSETYLEFGIGNTPERLFGTVIENNHLLEVKSYSIPIIASGNKLLFTLNGDISVSIDNISLVEAEYMSTEVTVSGVGYHQVILDSETIPFIVYVTSTTRQYAIFDTGSSPFSSVETELYLQTGTNTLYVIAPPDFSGIIDNISLKKYPGGDELITNVDFTGSASGWSLDSRFSYGSDNIVVSDSSPLELISNLLFFYYYGSAINGISGLENKNYLISLKIGGTKGSVDVYFDNMPA